MTRKKTRYSKTCTNSSAQLPRTTTSSLRSSLHLDRSTKFKRPRCSMMMRSWLISWMLNWRHLRETSGKVFIISSSRRYNKNALTKSTLSNRLTATPTNKTNSSPAPVPPLSTPFFNNSSPKSPSSSNSTNKPNAINSSKETSRMLKNKPSKSSKKKIKKKFKKKKNKPNS